MLRVLMQQQSVLDAWIQHPVALTAKRSHQTLLDGWIIASSSSTRNDHHPESAMQPLSDDSGSDRDAVDLYRDMPALNSDSDDSSVDSRPDLPIPESDGYLWNLVPPINYQYLDADAIHTESSSSDSSEDCLSDDSFVCDEEEVYTWAEQSELMALFPKTVLLLPNLFKRVDGVVPKNRSPTSKPV
jgi:hypothetical protein